ncbi:Fungal-trans domain-containing protein [Mycena sanguinolenta]|uniref:Fungal-trans domain-containing protein n=1 Tax=Mycena sanguinolenta TaxID=230812 RepID=A0A8H6XFM3_9AGAR|nr:Fungal-trans domain-containing protein [Mycena sanguinolenta]
MDGAGIHDDQGKDEKRDVKPIVKTLNRVPRACVRFSPRREHVSYFTEQNACRKQKMRCEGADNPPCRRCRNTGLECLFEKPSREATLTGEAGLERIRSLEAHVAEIRHTQTSIQSSVAEILSHLRGGAAHARSPSYLQSSYHQSPVLHSPSMSTPPAGHQHVNDGQPPTPTSGFPHTAPSARQSRPQLPPPGYQGPSSQTTLGSYSHYPAQGPGYASSTQSGQGPVLPPFSSIQTMGPPSAQQANVSSIRYDNGHPQSRQHSQTSGKRHASGSANVTSADSSDIDEDEGDLPDGGLVAPLEVLRGLADVATERAAKLDSSSRFYHGCSTFLPVFDSNSDTFDALHDRSPFAVDCICMVAARVRDGGGKASDIYLQTLEEVQTISRATLFSPVTRHEAVQAMILVAGWSDNGWLSGGHAVRMAMELSMHKAWPSLLKRMNANQVDLAADRELVIASRIWFCLYLFEHQLSYGTGRPAVLKDDESIKHCRLLLQHPLAIEDDMRLVSTVELMALRERVHNALSPFEGPVKDEHFEELRRADLNFRSWYATWDQAFSQKYEDAAFYRQSLQIQHLHAELFHNATALRAINGPEDVQSMPPQQKELALRSIQIARQALDITVNSPAYREGMKYAVHYTHATATFAASFFVAIVQALRNARNTNPSRTLGHAHGGNSRQTICFNAPSHVETIQEAQVRLIHLAFTQDLRDSHRPMVMAVDPSHPGNISQHHSEPFSPAYESFTSPGSAHPSAHPPTHQVHLHATDADHIWRGFEMTASEQLPVWISDQTLGGNSFSQNGMNAFLLPQDYLPPTPQIW